MGGKMAEDIMKFYSPSRILVLKGVATLKSTKDDNSFSDLYSDIMDKCSTYGKVLEIKIPRPIWIDRSDMIKAEDEFNPEG
jgi:hypothetical protein